MYGSAPQRVGLNIGRVVLMSILGGAFVLLFAQSVEARCTKDTDCKGDRICEKGKCVYSEKRSKPQRVTPSRKLIVVFDTQGDFDGAKGQIGHLKPGWQKRLRRHLVKRLKSTGLYKVVSNKKVKKATTTKTGCKDFSCRVSLCRKLGVAKYLYSAAKRDGDICTITAALYDIRKAKSGRPVVVSGSCVEEGIKYQANTLVYQLVYPGLTPIVVFDVQVELEDKLASGWKNRLREHLVGQLMETRLYKIIPKEEVAKELAGKSCGDFLCRLRVSHQLGALKYLYSNISHSRNMCSISAAFYDVKSKRSGQPVVVSSVCLEKDIKRKMGSAVTKLVFPRKEYSEYSRIVLARRRASGCTQHSDCPQKHICKEGRCLSEATIGYMATQKSAVASWALEFFLGFGIGHYYAGRVGWGVYGSIMSTIESVGIGLMVGYVRPDFDCRGYCVAGAIAFGVGELGHVISWIAAPILTASDNRKKLDMYLYPHKYKGNAYVRTNSLHVWSSTARERERLKYMRLFSTVESTVIIPVFGHSF